MVDLVIFTCVRREHLLLKSYTSFKNACDYKFNSVILAIDGQIDASVVELINPDLVIQHTQRKGYVNSIVNTIKVINCPYFFWLEDDWAFHQQINLSFYLTKLSENINWAEIIYSQFGPLKPEFKINPLGDHLYQTTFGFSANPAICNTKHIKTGFSLLETAPKGDTLGQDGFENFLTKTFEKEGIKCVIIDPVNHLAVSHIGYLESTPRNWHMTNSLENKTKAHLLTIPSPSFARKCLMVIKLFFSTVKLSVWQFSSNKVYEFCFRVMASAKTIKNDD